MKITNLKTSTDESVLDVVETLEETLEKAKDGQIISIGICCVLEENRIQHDIGGYRDLAALLGACSLLHNRIAKTFE